MDQEQSATERSFLATLAMDVQYALDQADQSKRGSDHRNALRAIISAIEGAVWIYRAHVLSVAQSLGMSTSKLELAFSEMSVHVSEEGKIKEQQRFVATTAMIRLATRTAEELCPGLEIDFSDAAWSKLRSAIRLRNRITHPKSLEDLSVSLEDLDAAQTGFNWFLTNVAMVMEATLGQLKAFNVEAKDFIEKLNTGDPDTIALYERARRAPDEP
ncbi:hypothetical protein TomMM35A_01440 [Sphingobium sp. TomMM35A]